MLRGIDVSHHQKDVNWLKVASDDVRFAFAKATEGLTYIDSSFSRNWNQMREVGLVRGTYHFARPGSDPEAQAEHFASVVGALGSLDLPPVLDLEISDGHPAHAVLAWSRAFIHRTEALFRREVMIYTGGFWRFTLGNPNDSFFGTKPLWLPAYNQNPVLPASWSKWTFWQYTDGTHNVPAQVAGIQGPVDQNRFFGSLEELHTLCEGAKPLSEPFPSADSASADWPGVHFVWPRMPLVSGESVRRWQRQMTSLGYEIDADGTYGPQSKAACCALQRERGLPVDGIVGRKTWNACFSSPEADRTP